MALKWISLAAAALLFADAQAGTLDVKCVSESPQCAYAARRLGESPASSSQFELRVDAALGPEAFAIDAAKGRVIIRGGDNRGLVYGALAAREQLLNGTAPGKLTAKTQRPALAFRGIKFNTPWDTYRPSSALDQHYATVRDLNFWEAYLDMMVENRFNAISLWTLHPFTYMIRPKNFPEASKWTDAEFAEWQQLYRGIFRLAKERGLDTYIVFWSIFVSPEFAKAPCFASRHACLASTDGKDD